MGLDFDGWIAKVKTGEHLPEWDLKQLCDYVKELLIEESNVQVSYCACSLRFARALVRLAFRPCTVPRIRLRVYCNGFPRAFLVIRGTVAATSGVQNYLVLLKLRSALVQMRSFSFPVRCLVAPCGSCL